MPSHVPGPLARAAALALLIAVTACTPTETDGTGDADPTDPDTVTLEVTSTTWNGWESPTAPPDATTDSVTVAEGDTITIDGALDTIVLTIEEIDDDGVDLISDSALVVTNPGGGADLDSPRTDFSLGNGEVLELMTPTLDAGTSIVLTVQD